MLVAIAALMLGLTLTQSGNYSDQLKETVSLAVFLLLLSIWLSYYFAILYSLIRLFMVIVPRVKGPKENDSFILFFHKISALSKQDFENEIKTISQERYTEYLATAYYANSRIAEKKFNNLRHAVWALAFAILFQAIVLGWMTFSATAA